MMESSAAIQIELNGNGEAFSSPLKSPNVTCFCDAKSTGKFCSKPCCGNKYEQINNRGPSELPRGGATVMEESTAPDVSMEFPENSETIIVEAAPTNKDCTVESEAVVEVENANEESDNEEFDICPISPLRKEDNEADTDTQESKVSEEEEEEDVVMDNEVEIETDDPATDTPAPTNDSTAPTNDSTAPTVADTPSDVGEVDSNVDSGTNAISAEEESIKVSQMESVGLISTKLVKEKESEKARDSANEMNKSSDDVLDMDIDEAGNIIVKKEPVDLGGSYDESTFETLREGVDDDDLAKIDDFEIWEEGPKRRRPKKALPSADGKPTKRQLLVFEKGWKRELVFRNPTEPKDGKLSLKRAGDVYYWPPIGKKLRSIPQVEAYLEEHPDPDIGLDCFSFNKNPIYKEPFEIIRQAGSQGLKRKSGASSALVLPKTPKQVRPTHVVRVVTPGKLTSANISAAGSPSHIIKISAPAELPGFGPASARKRLGPGSINLKPKRFKAAPESLEKIKLVSSNKEGAEENHIQLTPPPLMQICGMQCPGRQMVPPSLHCGVCLCLFHPECVNFIGSSRPALFICLRCKKQAGSTRPANSGSSKSITGNLVQPPKLYSAQTLVSKSQETSGLRITDVISQAVLNGDVNGSTGQAPAAPKPMPPLHKAPITGALPTLLGHTRSPPVLSGPGQQSVLRTVISTKPTGSPVTAQALQTALASMTQSSQSGSPVVAPSVTNSAFQLSSPPPGLKGQLLALPPNVLTKLNLQQPLALRINNQQLLIQPSSFVFTPQGLKILLPEGTLKDKENNKYKASLKTTLPKLPALSSAVSAPSGLPPLQRAPTVSNTPSENVTHGAKKTIVIPEKPNLRARPVRVKSVRVCHFKRLHVGFDCLLEIFRYLPIKERLRASCVCRTWRNVATQYTLCRRISLKGMCVHDWNGAAAYFTKHGVETLDLRGMQHGDDRNRAWHQLTAVLHQLHTVKHVHFGQCPALILHAVTEKMPHLVGLSSEWTTDTTAEENMWTTNTKVDVGKMSRLSDLEELKLRGVCGLILPQISFSGGIGELSSLTHLRKLSITTLNDVQADEFSFLPSLTKLEQLELGDCLNWTSQTFSYLGMLSGLKLLRLECGGEVPDEGLADALEKMRRLENLELIMYRIDETVMKVISLMKTLKLFSVWPDTKIKAGTMNNAILQGVSKMGFLEQFDWGVMPEDGADGNETQSSLAFIPFHMQPLKVVINKEIKTESEEKSNVLVSAEDRVEADSSPSEESQSAEADTKQTHEPQVKLIESEEAKSDHIDTEMIEEDSVEKDSHTVGLSTEPVADEILTPADDKTNDLKSDSANVDEVSSQTGSSVEIKKEKMSESESVVMETEKVETRESTSESELHVEDKPMELDTSDLSTNDSAKCDSLPVDTEGEKPKQPLLQDDDVIEQEIYEEYLSMDCLGERLCAFLPGVKIRVYRIPVVVNGNRNMIDRNVSP